MICFLAFVVALWLGMIIAAVIIDTQSYDYPSKKKSSEK